jgi:hypothetical protein
MRPPGLFNVIFRYIAELILLLRDASKVDRSRMLWRWQEPLVF